MPQAESRGQETPETAGQEASGVDIATARTPGIDVARALAILGMVLVNYRMKLEVGSRGPEWLSWLSDRLDGRASALFVVLAGMGISLRSRRAREAPAQYLAFERAALLKRAAVLFAAGLLNLHMWPWDILHSYGLFLSTAAFLLNVRGFVLWVLAAVCMSTGSLLQVVFDYNHDLEFWSLAGAPTSMLFNGPYPYFPWMVFLLVGMWVGRLDLNEDRTRRRLLLFAIGIAFIGELVDSVSTRAEEVKALSEEAANWLSSWPSPPSPVYIATACATALAVICSCIEWTRSYALSLAVVALTATGQLAFTQYILHAIFILIPLEHGLFEDASLFTSIAYSFAFYAVAVAISLWWRRRYPVGPLETLIRQITGRSSTAPWGGQLVGTTKQ